jgi:hypothetical protein
VKLTLGNRNNDASFIATLLAKRYLIAQFQIGFDAAARPRGASGIDIDLMTPNGERVIAEIKTTLPYGLKDFGAAQGASFKRDFEKLKMTHARHKLLFVRKSRVSWC